MFRGLETRSGFLAASVVPSGPVLEFSSFLNYAARTVHLSVVFCEVESRTYCGRWGPRVAMRVPAGQAGRDLPHAPQPGSLRCVAH
jgi:hypothetical protein